MKHVKVNDFIVYPGHGVGQIYSIENKKILGTVNKFCHIQILDNYMKIMFPLNEADRIGIRAIVSKAKAKRILASLKETSTIPLMTWNQHYRHLMDLLKTGDIDDLATALKELRPVKFMKGTFRETFKIFSCR